MTVKIFAIFSAISQRIQLYDLSRAISHGCLFLGGEVLQLKIDITQLKNFIPFHCYVAKQSPILDLFEMHSSNAAFFNPRFNPGIGL